MIIDMAVGAAVVLWPRMITHPYWSLVAVVVGVNTVWEIKLMA